MNHQFQSNPLNIILCVTCHKELNSHFLQGKCEICDSDTFVTLIPGNLSACGLCRSKELLAYKESQSSTNQQSRIDQMNLTSARAIDESVSIRTDLFNAATVSIIELKTLIEADDSIINKNFALAAEVRNRFYQFTSLIFEKKAELEKLGNEQKAHQIYLNQLANQLRIEEREKLKIADINYKPVSPIKSPKAITVKKFDKAELRNAAKEIGIPEFALQILIVSKGMTVEQAKNHMKQIMNSSKVQ